MPARLIVNADDFGLTPGINRAIGELHAAGVLTSATLMASGPAFADAVAVAHAHPTLGIGAHIVLTDGVPVSDPATIPTLLGPDGRTFRPALSSFVAAVLAGRIDPAHVYREALAQLNATRAAGIHPTHIDTPKHTHIFPSIARPLLRAAEDAGITAIRYPFEPAAIAHATRNSTPRLRRFQLQSLRAFEPRLRAAFAAHPHLRTTDGTFGISATGSLNRDTLRILLAAIQATPTGTFELCCHPGYNDADLDPIRTRLREHRNIEREALLAEIPHVLTQPNAPRLIHYAAL